MDPAGLAARAARQWIYVEERLLEIQAFVWGERARRQVARALFKRSHRGYRIARQRASSTDIPEEARDGDLGSV